MGISASALQWFSSYIADRTFSVLLVNIPPHVHLNRMVCHMGLFWVPCCFFVQAFSWAYNPVVNCIFRFYVVRHLCTLEIRYNLVSPAGFYGPLIRVFWLFLAPDCWVKCDCFWNAAPKLWDSLLVELRSLNFVETLKAFKCYSVPILTALYYANDKPFDIIVNVKTNCMRLWLLFQTNLLITVISYPLIQHNDYSQLWVTAP